MTLRTKHSGWSLDDSELVVGFTTRLAVTRLVAEGNMTTSGERSFYMQLAESSGKLHLHTAESGFQPMTTL